MIISHYCVIICVDHFLTSDFCLITDLYAKIPDFYAKIPDLYADIFLLVFQCSGNVRGCVPVDCLRSIANDSACAMRGRGGITGERWRWKPLNKYVRKIILARNLLYRAEAQYRVPVRLLVPQSNDKASSTDHVGVKPCHRNWNMDIDPTTCVWNGLIWYSWGFHYLWHWICWLINLPYFTSRIFLIWYFLICLPSLHHKKTLNTKSRPSWKRRQNFLPRLLS